MNYTFKPPFTGACPACNVFGRSWYIIDRQISDSDCYEYCLMSVSTESKKTLSFKNIRKVTEWICDIEDLSKESEWYIKNWYLRRYLKSETHDAMLLEKDGTHYRLNKHNFTITQLHKHQQETGWCASYAECLALAKDILKNKEKEQFGEQVNLFV